MEIIIPTHIRLTEIKGKMILLDTKRDFFYSMSHSGILFLGLIQSGNSFDRSVQIMSEKYNVHKDQLEKDLKTFSYQLQGKGLLEIK